MIFIFSGEFTRNDYHGLLGHFVATHASFSSSMYQKRSRLLVSYCNEMQWQSCNSFKTQLTKTTVIIDIHLTSSRKKRQRRGSWKTSEKIQTINDLVWIRYKKKIFNFFSLFVYLFSVSFIVSARNFFSTMVVCLFCVPICQRAGLNAIWCKRLHNGIKKRFFISYKKRIIWMSAVV